AVTSSSPHTAYVTGSTRGREESSSRPRRATRERSSSRKAHEGSSATLALDPMIARRLGVTALAAIAAALAGCGSGGAQHTPDVSSIPLVAGARIVAQQQKCDRGANAFCGWELVVEAPRYKSSDDLLLR